MHLSLILFAGLALLLESCYCLRMLKVIPGIPTVRYYNKEYVQDVVANTRRYSRRSDYALNLEFTTLATLGKNVSISIILYEYLHNEYRKSFIEFHYNICTLILKDQIIGVVVRKFGITVCPLPVGRYRLLNVTFDQEFPNVFPFEKGKGELVVQFTPSGKLIAKGDLVLTFQQRNI